MKRFLVLIILLVSFVGTGWAHDIPSSRLDVRVSSASVTVTLDAPVSGWAHDFLELSPQTVVGKQAEIEKLAIARLALLANGKPLAVSSVGAAQLLPINRGETPLRLSLSAPLPAGTETLTVRGRLFPTDPKHRTVLVVRGAEGQLLHEAILTPDKPEAVVKLGTVSAQSPLAVFVQFVQQGVYHIAIGPDHILFVVALLLMGGSLFQLLKVVTAFTVAHSITLVLAALGIVKLPGSFVEPVIAASIVFVGIRVLQRFWREGDTEKKNEERLPYAFGFGLIHGFGFAGALAELELPRQALAISLFGFNVGVEIGQAILVLLIAPLLAWLHRRSPVPARRLIIAIALIVVAAGAYWFGERIAG